MSSDIARSPLVESPATLAPVAPAPAARRPRRHRGGAAVSIAAQGEPLVWLTGGALVVALAMIVGLLAFIVIQGVSTFWPSPVVQIRTIGGQVFLGEVADHNEYAPSSDALAALDPAAVAKAKEAMSAGGGKVRRQLLQTGNFELTGTDSRWIDDHAIAETTQPDWALVLERLENGRFYGAPTAFLLDGKEIATTPEAVWNKFNEVHDGVRERFRRRVAIEKDELGAVSRRQMAARIDVVRTSLSYNEEGSTVLNKETPEYRAAEQRQAEVESAAQTEKARLNEEIAKLVAENARYALRLATADGQSKEVPVEQIVRAYPANQLGWWGKVGVYFSRWGEFLFDDPREANSEGGVFPAIWGTVAMTLILAVLVVPFGVLAALYLREYAKEGPIVSAVRIAINNLAGVPSIVFGVFGLGFFCYGLGQFIDVGPIDIGQDYSVLLFTKGQWWSWLAALAAITAVAIYCSYRSLRRRPSDDLSTGRRYGIAGLVLWLVATGLAVLLISQCPYFHGFFRADKIARQAAPTFGTGGLLWASLTLALLTLPVVIVSTEEALAAVPKSMREGSYACGASKWQTIRRIVLPRALPGIMTGMILAMARGAGEVAPLMLVGVQKIAKDLPIDGVFPFVHPERSIMHLGFHVYDVAMQSRNSEAGKLLVFTTTLLLIAIIATLNIAAIWLRARLRRKFVASHF